MKRINMLSGCLGLVFLTACPPDETGHVTILGSTADLPTSAISVFVDATESEMFRISVQLATGQPSQPIVLSRGDRLMATVGTQVQPMAFSTLGTYVATFPPPEAGAEIRVDFEREAGGMPSLVSARGVMPARFELGPLPPTFSRSKEDLTVTWSPPMSATMGRPRLEVSGVPGQCALRPLYVVPADTGSYTFARGSFETVGLEQGHCPVQVTFIRTVDGLVGAGFSASSKMSLTRSRSSTFSTQP